MKSQTLTAENKIVRGKKKDQQWKKTVFVLMGPRAITSSLPQSLR